ncbi:hypothetical protein [Rhizobium sp. BK251]|uniref:hypothetical protein n=1 Tax=Rhizobium sp. BK251 TaxID=2512125 RepID=UPI001052FC1F|nr:hypothetical protein [Rhizobium sp. BK251]TCL70515.1 hypothetical protein EV286_107390 [Rhizobium sp. BK251]
MTDEEINKARVSALLNLEAQICDLADMVQVMQTLLNRYLVDKDTREPVGQIINIQLGAGEMRMLSFAWTDVSSRAESLQHKFYEAAETGVC